ncbi:antiseptic resistance protein [Staphylococcus aureus]|uniref:Antiseptic resistance protein n=1 Tax=Staphylococcus aureus TaxID=1280 RepID=A0A8S1IAT3_STAAU|nr:MFS transporter [Staphylococcus aureus]CAD7355229.1 antiseptic resistance protein [Staphylococcus aureus]
MISFFTKTTDMMTSKKRWTALVVLAVSLFVVTMDMTILIMALPELVRELEPSGTQQLWIVDIYSLVLAGFIIPLSAFADKWGRKKALLTGFALFGLVSLAIFFRRKCRVRNSYSIFTWYCRCFNNANYSFNDKSNF